MTKTNSKDLLRLEAQMVRDRSDARDSRKETNDILKEVRSDIKQLMREGRVQHFTDRTIPPGRGSFSTGRRRQLSGSYAGWTT